MQRIMLCDVSGHPTPILLEWSYGLKDLGYTVDYLPIPQSTLHSITEHYDMLVYAGVPVEKLQEFTSFKNKFPKTKIIGATDHWRNGYEHFKGIVDFFIGCFESIPSVKQIFNQHGYQFYNIPLAANHRFFYKKEIEKVYDASFIGTFSHGYRFEDVFLYPILNNCKYKCFLGGVTYGNYQNGFIKYEDHNIIRNQTKINLNMHVPYQKPNMGIPVDRVDCNQSIFNIAASGNFQLCDHPLANDYFKGNVAVGDSQNWLELFEYYLHNDEEREEKAYNAKQICMAEHTWIERMKQFLTLCKEHYDAEY